MKSAFARAIFPRMTSDRFGPPSSPGVVWVTNGCRARKLPLTPTLVIRLELAQNSSVHFQVKFPSSIGPSAVSTFVDDEAILGEQLNCSLSRRHA